MKDAELSKHSPAIVVDFFSRQTIVGVKRIHAAKRKINSSSSCRKAPPRAKMCAANHHFKHDRFVGDVPVQYFYFQIRHCLHKLLVKLPDSGGSFVMLAPSFVIIMSSVAEGAKYAVEVMRVFKANVLLDNCDAGRSRVDLWSACGN